MNQKIIETEVTQDRVIHIEDSELPPGKVKLIVLLSDDKTEKRLKNINKLPFGGHKADWRSHEDLRRVNMYKDR